MPISKIKEIGGWRGKNAVVSLDLDSSSSSV